MPELPEVEAIRSQLETFLKGHKIEDVIVSDKRSFLGDRRDIIGSCFVEFSRFGKVLFLGLDNDFSLIVHLKLTGQLVYRGPNLRKPPPLSEKIVGGLPGRYTRVVFKLDRNGFLYFNDLRVFGWIKVVKNSEFKPEELVKRLGYEPPAVPSPSLPTLTLKDFSNILSKSKKAVKLILMDQEKIAGIGNIYANDALFLAGIDPRRPANSLRDYEQNNLYNSIIKVLKDGIKRGGSSENTFVNVDGTEGKYQDFTFVYGKVGQNCPRCGAEIKKIQLGGRGTYFCEGCQK